MSLGRLVTMRFVSVTQARTTHWEVHAHRISAYAPAESQSSGEVSLRARHRTSTVNDLPLLAINR